MLQKAQKMDLEPDSKDYERMALENLRIGVRYFVSQYGKIGVIRIVREVCYILQDEGYSGVSTLLESIKDFFFEEGDTAPKDVRVTWQRVARQIRYVIQEALTNGRELP